ncbi:KfrB domain-containing protein [Pseudomonas sp. S1(2024)]|uniref:KfrB domain-containing protein n=1 Tax=Pseudomonas sp. S1(2024) TaxID=3390191 RepID=UPI003978ECC4
MKGYFPSVLMKPERSLKICVLNGSRQIEMVIDGQWVCLEVKPEAGLPRGIYQLADAKDPTQTRESAAFSSAIVHVNDRHVWQFSDDGIVKHARSLFKGEPKVGQPYDVSYEGGRGIAVDVPQQERAKHRVHTPESGLSLGR